MSDSARSKTANVRSGSIRLLESQSVTQRLSMIHIKQIPERPSQKAIDAIAKFSPATLHEAQGRRGALSSRLKPVDYRMKLCGPAFTVKCAPRDNIMLQLAINYAKPGDIIVVSAGEYEEAGSFGDVLANACLAKGIGGLVTDTGVRDTLQLRDLGFPVFSLSVCIKGTVKETLAAVNDPITIGDELVYPGRHHCRRCRWACRRSKGRSPCRGRPRPGARGCRSRLYCRLQGWQVRH